MRDEQEREKQVFLFVDCLLLGDIGDRADTHTLTIIEMRLIVCCYGFVLELSGWHLFLRGFFLHGNINCQFRCIIFNWINKEQNVALLKLMAYLSANFRDQI